MGVEEQLQSDEEVVYRAHVTRISLVPWIAGLVLVIVGGVVASQIAPEPWLLILAGVLAVALGITLLFKLVVLRSYEHVLTNRRLIQQTGILNKRSSDAPLDKVNNVEHQQTLWGRMLGYGDVEIDTASEHGCTRFANISRPLEFKNAIAAAAETYRSRRFAPVAAPSAAPSGADRLRELKSLLDDGLISPEEFEVKRRKLLEEI